MTVYVAHRTGGRRFGPTALGATALGVTSLGGTAACAASPGPGPLPASRIGGYPRLAPLGGPTRYQRVGDDRRTRPPAGLVPSHRSAVVTACPAGSSADGYRMGRWARLSMTLVVTAAILVAALLLAFRPVTVPTRFVTVQAGDTLASIVGRDLVGTDRAEAIALVESLNGLDGPAVEVGTVLRIPAG